MEQTAQNDNRHWYIKGPDKDGNAWLVWEGEGEPQMLNLGQKEEVGAMFCDWLCRIDFGDCGS